MDEKELRAEMSVDGNPPRKQVKEDESIMLVSTWLIFGCTTFGVYRC